jgi:hypothetical protein
LNLAHLHLLLNHWPIIGTYIGVALLFVAVVARSNDIKHVSYGLFAFLALGTIPAYLSGNAAAEATKDLNFSMVLVETHEGAALLAFMFLELTGLLALVELWRFTRNGRESSFSKLSKGLSAVLILSILTAVLMAVAGVTGGDIRHPEIVKAGEASPAIATVGSGLIQSIRYFVIDYSRWAWPIIEDLHFIGLILIMGTVGLLDIRVLGFLKKLPVGPLHRLLPWGIAGLVINVITGVMFFIGMPGFYVFNTIFQAKILTILFAAGNLLLFFCTGVFRKWERVGPGEDAPLFAKLVAASSLLLWLAVIFLGRYIPVGEQ